jgi:uncharacterized membrane protein YeaQ/YmgE (transglycosylase-associated protein family)
MEHARFSRQQHAPANVATSSQDSFTGGAARERLRQAVGPDSAATERTLGLDGRPHSGLQIAPYGRRETSMSIIWTLIIGLLAGIVAKLLMPGRDPGGFIITILLGIAGAFLATWLGQAIGWYEAGEGAGFIGAVVGAVIILIIYRMIARRRSAT